MAATGESAAWTIEKGLTLFLVTDIIKLAIAAGVFPFAWWVVGRRPDAR